MVSPIGPWPENITWEELKSRLAYNNYDEDQWEEIQRNYDPAVYEYPEDLGPYSQAFWAGVRILTDGNSGLFAAPTGVLQDLGFCSSRRLAKSLAAYGTPSVYLYSFERPSETSYNAAMQAGYSSPYFVGHSGEMQHFFGGCDVGSSLLWGANQLSEADCDLARTTAMHRARFVATGNPNGDGLPEWPAATVRRTNALRYKQDGSVAASAVYQEASCSMWDRWQDVSEVGLGSPWPPDVTSKKSARHKRSGRRKNHDDDDYNYYSLV